MKSLSLLLILGFLSIQSVNHQPQRKIEYILGSEIKKEIKKLIKEIKEEYKERKTKPKDTDFYIRIGHWENRTLYVHVDAFGRNLDKTAIKNTNRYVQLTKKIQLPIVFGFDERLSSDFREEDCTITMATNHSGKWLFMDNHGCYLVNLNE